MFEHALRLSTSFFITLAIIATLLAPDSSLMGSILFWPTMLLDRIFIPDPDYFDLEIMFASLFISIGSYALAIYVVSLCLSKINYRLKNVPSMSAHNKSVDASGAQNGDK